MEVLESKDVITGIGARALLVAYDEPSLLAAKMMYALDLPFPLLLDPKKEAYRRWGLGRTTPFGAFLSPGLNWRYLKLLLRGKRFLGFAPDMFQLGGDFIVDRLGRIAFAHAMTNNGDRVQVTALLSVLQRIAAND